VDRDGRLRGVLTAEAIRKSIEEGGGHVSAGALAAHVKKEPFSAFGDEPLRVVVNRMAETGVTRMPVVDRDSMKLLGLVSLEGVLKARARHQEDEVKRDQTLWLPYFAPPRSASTKEGS
jgi:CBS domain-containing protein